MGRSDRLPGPLGLELLVHPLRTVLRHQGRHVVQIQRRPVTLRDQRVHPVPHDAGDERGSGVERDVGFPIVEAGVKLGRRLIGGRKVVDGDAGGAGDGEEEEGKGDGEGDEGEDVVGEDWGGGSEVEDGGGGEEGDEEDSGDPVDSEGGWVGDGLEALLVGEEGGDGEVGEDLQEEEDRLDKLPLGSGEAGEGEDEEDGVEGGEEGGDHEGELEPEVSPDNDPGLGQQRLVRVEVQFSTAAAALAVEEVGAELVEGEREEEEEEDGIDGGEEKALWTGREENEAEPFENRRRLMVF